MKKTVKKALSLLLVFVMFMSMGVIPAMAEDQKTYAFLGDSMTYNFVERNNYLEPINIFAEKVADAMRYTLDEHGAIPGGRLTDAYALISDYEGDEYFKSECASLAIPESYRDFESYPDVVKNADVLSIQMGYSATTMVMLTNLMSILGGTGNVYSVDLNQIFTQSEVEKIMPIVAKAKEFMNNIFSEEIKAALCEYVNTLTAAEQEGLKKIFGEEIINAVNGVSEIVGPISDNLTYMFVSQIVHFDRLVERIYEINQDVELYIMGLTNPMQNLNLAFTFGELSYIIPLGDMLGVFYDTMNIYMKVLSPYSTKYYFVDNVNHAHSYGEAMAENVDVASDILYSFYDDGHWLDYDDQIHYENPAARAWANERAYGVSKALRNTQTIDITGLLMDLPEDISDISINMDASILDKFTSEYVYEDGDLMASYLDQVMLNVFLFQIMKGIFVHPDQAGHDVQAHLLIKAMQKKQVAPEAIAYHKMVSPMEQAIKELNKCDSIYEFIDWTQSLDRVAAQMKTSLTVGLAALFNSFMKEAVRATVATIRNIFFKTFAFPFAR